MSPCLPAIAIVMLLACSACGPAAPPTDPARPATPPAGEGSSPAAPVDAASSADTVEGTSLRYECDDGSVVRVTYGGEEQARIELPGGPTISLPKAQSASRGAGDVFVGETISLQRNGDELQVVRTAGKTLQCRAAAVTE
jgi:membrane-bound lysozyme inhibitor of c-type lysozyme MliC